MFTALLFDVITRYPHSRTQLLCIEELDERTLRDIGFSRDELYAEARQRAGGAVY